MLNIAHGCVTEEVNGPGRRFTVWVQGCPRDCPGCFNPGLRSFESRQRVLPGDLARLASATGPLDGVSFSGGEPFAQAKGLTEFLEALRSQPGFQGLPALAFTGYTVEEIREGPAAWIALLQDLDLLVDGPYREDQPTALPLRGSANQRLIALTPAGEWMRRAIESHRPPDFGVIIAADGQILFTGFPPRELLREFSGP